jgi:hypothetical protein
MGVKKFWSEFVRKTIPVAADTLMLGDATTGDAKYCKMEDLPLSKAAIDYINIAINNLKNEGVIAASWAGEMRPFFGVSSKIPADWALVPNSAPMYSKTDYPDYYEFLGEENNPFGVTATQFCGIWIPEGYTIIQCGDKYQFAKLYGSFAETLNVDQIPAHDHIDGIHTQNGSEFTDTENILPEQDGWRISFYNGKYVLTRTQKTGGGKEHNNLSPGIAGRWIVKLKNTGGSFTTSELSLAVKFAQSRLIVGPDGKYVTDHDGNVVLNDFIKPTNL